MTLFKKTLSRDTRLSIALFGLILPWATYSQNRPPDDQPNSRVRPRQVNQSPPNADSTKDSTRAQLTPRQIVERVFPSIVLIVAEDEHGEAVGLGSGFFYKPGLVATNLHVLRRASQASVKVLKSGISYKVTSIASIDRRRDLCLMRIDDMSTPPLGVNASDQPEVGDEVYVASNPKGLEGSFSKGIVSGKRTYAGLIQIDAAISPGSSGGAVVNARAELIGIAVSSVVGGQNLNFAIPVGYLHALKLNLRVPVVVAGAFSLTDRDKDKLKGLVQSVSEKEASYEYDEQRKKYYEKPSGFELQWKYDLDGNNVEFTAHGGKSADGHIVNVYDDQGFLTYTKQQYPDGTKHEFAVSLDKSMSERIDNRRFSVTTGTSAWKSRYDRDGNEIERTSKYSSGLGKHVFSYDRNGFVREEKIYLNGSLRSVSRYEYETDDAGNWIKKYKSTAFGPEYSEDNSTPESVTYREITYHR